MKGLMSVSFWMLQSLICVLSSTWDAVWILIPTSLSTFTPHLMTQWLRFATLILFCHHFLFLSFQKHLTISLAVTLFIKNAFFGTESWRLNILSYSNAPKVFFFYWNIEIEKLKFHFTKNWSWVCIIFWSQLKVKCVHTANIFTYCSLSTLCALSTWCQ